jgi:SAM-dependent methyltransferase
VTDRPALDRVRAAYDTVAADYALLLRDELGSHPIDRAALTVFVDLVGERREEDGSTGLVADLGCGPGRVAAHLHERGLDVVGIDLSPAMIAEAARAHPGLRFEVGSLATLPFDDGALAGAVCWYSIIHTPGDELPAVSAELRRVLRPGGVALLAFQVGDHVDHLRRAYGHDIELDAHRHHPDRVAACLTAAGFEVTARFVRAPHGAERHPQAFLFANRSASPR